MTLRDLPHVSDDEGECWCNACTRKLLKANDRYLRKWIERDRNGERTPETKT